MRLMFCVMAGSTLHATPSKKSNTPTPPAQTCFASAPHTLYRFAVVGDFNGVQLVPFQCTIAPLTPTAHTSSLAAAQTDVSACACGSGCSSVHVPQPTSNDGGGTEALQD